MTDKMNVLEMARAKGQAVDLTRPTYAAGHMRIPCRLTSLGWSCPDVMDTVLCVDHLGVRPMRTGGMTFRPGYLVGVG